MSTRWLLVLAILILGMGGVAAWFIERFHQTPLRQAYDHIHNGMRIETVYRLLSASTCGSLIPQPAPPIPGSGGLNWEDTTHRVRVTCDPSGRVVAKEIRWLGFATSLT